MPTLTAHTEAVTGACSAEQGGMGLRGVWALIGNSTGMVIVAVLLFAAAWQLQLMHGEEIGTLRQLHIEERDFNRQTLKGLGAVIERNSGAIDGLAGEIRKLREGP